MAESALFEHQFWLQILGDHGRFILNSLAPKEVREIELAHYFITTFDTLLAYARQSSSSSDLLSLTQEAYRKVNEFREFKLHLLRRHLVDGLEIHLTPTFINHMVNELEEYLLILQGLLRDGSVPLCHPIHYHTIWLLDAEGHAGFLQSSLDEVEADLREKSVRFKKTFEGLNQKALEFKGYLRSGIFSFPALDRLNCQADREIELFKKFLVEMLHLRVSLEALGSLSPLAPDHMYCEECYYLTKLAQVGAVPTPRCDPTNPRIQI